MSADGDDDAVELVDAELSERFLVGRVGLHHVGKASGEGGNVSFVGVDSKHFDIGVREFERQRRAEPSQADDDSSARAAVAVAVFSQ